MDEQSLSFRLLAILFPIFDIVAAGYFYGRKHKPEMAVANRINKAVYDALQNPETRSAFEATGNLIVSPTSVADLDRVYRDEIARYQAIAKSINFEPQ